MSISKFFTTSVAVSRMVWSGGKSSESSVGTFSAHIQQANPNFAEQLGETWGLVFSLWCAKGTNVQTGDTLVVATGDYAGTYNVRNVQTNATGVNEHLELVLIKDV